MTVQRLGSIASHALGLVLVATSLLGWPFGVPGAGAVGPAGQVSPVPLHAGAASPMDPPLMPASPRAVTHPIPRRGDQRLLIVLVDFPDQPGLFKGQVWHQEFFGSGGFADFYKEVSYNQLRYTGTVVGISGGVPVTNSNSVAYVRLPNPITYYADGVNGFNNNPGQFPKNISGVVKQALEALNSAGFDFAPYANPLTHVVDNLIVIYAGSAVTYTNDPVNSLGATAYRLTWGGGGIFTAAGGQEVDDYTVCPDQYANLTGQIARIGPCVHEQGHGLGDFDLYDFSYTTAGAGAYETMAAGAYGFSDGLHPVHFSAFSKELFGWITPTVAAVGTFTTTLGPAETGANYIKLAPHGNASSSEYFLLENRQPLGFDQDWLTGGLCPGLLIWHIDQNIVANYPYAVNTLASSGGPPHQGVVLVEADGGFDLLHAPINYGECSDTWATGQTWDASSTPNSHLWSDAGSGLAVTVVSESAGSVTLRITTDGLPFGLYLPAISR